MRERERAGGGVGGSLPLCSSLWSCGEKESTKRKGDGKGGLGEGDRRDAGYLMLSQLCILFHGKNSMITLNTTSKTKITIKLNTSAMSELKQFTPFKDHLLEEEKMQPCNLWSR